VSSLSAAQLSDLVAKTKLICRIEDDDEVLSSDGFAIYHNETASATAATVQVTDTKLILIITGGSNAGTDTFLLSASDKDTLTELVTLINDLNKGFVATLLGKSDVDSDRLIRKAATSCFGVSNEQTLTVVNNALLELLITDIWAKLESDLDRGILSTDYDEIVEVGAGGLAILAEPQVADIDFLGVDFQNSFTAKYDGTDLTASVEVTDTAVVTRSTDSNGATTTTTSTFASNASVSDLVTTIGALTGWTATQQNDGDSDLLRRYGPRSAKDTEITIERWEEYDLSYHVDWDRGVIDFLRDIPRLFGGRIVEVPIKDEVRVKYTAGYSTMPADVEIEVIRGVRAAWYSSGKDTAVFKEKLGDYEYEMSKMAEWDPYERLRGYERVGL
jgi:hypothetical protein